MEHLRTVDFSEIQASNAQLLDLFHSYLKILPIAKLNSVVNMRFTDSPFLFESTGVFREN